MVVEFIIVIVESIATNAVLIQQPMNSTVQYANQSDDVSIPKISNVCMYVSVRMCFE